MKINLLKFFKAFALILFTCVFISCSDSNDPTTTLANLMVK